MTTGVSRLVAATTSHGQAHVQLGITGDMGNHVIGVFHLNIVINLDISGGNDTRALLLQSQNRAILTVHHNRNVLEVEQDFNNVFPHTLNCAVLVQHTVNLGFSNGTARHGGEQNTP